MTTKTMKTMKVLLLASSVLLSGLVQAESDYSSKIAFEAGYGINYGILGGAVNYEVAPDAELFLAGGTGYAVGAKYYLSDMVRASVSYGINSYLSDFNKSMGTLHKGMNVGIGYIGGSRDGWTADLIYVVSSDVPDDAIIVGGRLKLSFGYRF